MYRAGVQTPEPRYGGMLAHAPEVRYIIRSPLFTFHFSHLSADKLFRTLSATSWLHAVAPFLDAQYYSILAS